MHIYIYDDILYFNNSIKIYSILMAIFKVFFMFFLQLWRLLASLIFVFSRILKQIFTHKIFSSISSISLIRNDGRKSRILEFSKTVKNRYFYSTTAHSEQFYSNLLSHFELLKNIVR